MSRDAAMNFAKSSTTPTPQAAPTVAADAIEADVIPDGSQTAGATTGAPTKTELESSKFAIFAKKEAALQKERETLKREREEYLKEKAESDRIIKLGRDYDETFKTDKIAALKKLGWTDTDIINAMAEGKHEPTTEELARRIASEEAQKLKAELKSEREKEEQTNNEKLITGLKTEITDTIKKDLEKYEFCSFYGKEAETDAYQVIFDELKETGVMMSVAEALEVIEETYTSRYEELKKLKKLQPKVVEPEPQKTEARTATVSERRSQQMPSRPTPTLTNEARPTASAASTPVSKFETRDQKKERLAKSILEHGLRR